jgi:hypothetical protein
LEKSPERKRLRLPAGVASAFLLSGCLYTTHHFNSGRLLEPGHSSVTVGTGLTKVPGYGCPAGTVYDYRDSTGLHCVTEYGGTDYENGSIVNRPAESQPGPTTSTSTHYSLGYRLGVHGRLGPITGVELGLHLEAPTNPASGEFDLKLGLPVPGMRPYHHSLSAGWGIGAWADNSYFLEYAASRFWGGNDVFFNYRATYLATQLPDLRGSESKRRFNSKRRLIHQAALGFTWTLPEFPVLPDFIAPEVVLSYPLAPSGKEVIPELNLDDRMWDLNLGMVWSFK